MESLTVWARYVPRIQWEGSGHLMCSRWPPTRRSLSTAMIPCIEAAGNWPALAPVNWFLTFKFQQLVHGGPPASLYPRSRLRYSSLLTTPNSKRKEGLPDFQEVIGFSFPPKTKIRYFPWWPKHFHLGHNEGGLIWVPIYVLQTYEFFNL